MENTASISFLSGAEKFTLMAYHIPRQYSVIASEVISRLAASILLSAGAALDIALHSLFVLPAFIYAIGKSVYQWKSDFNLPWRHIQRIRNAVAPLLFGSAFGILHPYAGLAMSEPTDKHIVLGILSSNTNQEFETPCSPIHSLSIVEELALNHRYVEKDGIQKEIFSPEHVKVIREAKSFEKSLESLQAQEYIHKITNSTLGIMTQIIMGIENSNLSVLSKEILMRLSGVLVPILTTVDIAITLIAQAFFLATGVARMISGRGAIYTEVTTNPIMHASFLIQNILKSIGNLVGTLVWFVSPMSGFKVSLFPAHMFFKMQMSILMSRINRNMHFAKNNERFVIPIVFGEGECSALSVPTHSMHKTYLIVEKQNNLFNLYWVNRPNVSLKQGLDSQAALAQIKSMLDERFPFMDIEKMMTYPVQSKKPEFSEAVNFVNIANQGNSTNCVVSNLFGMLEALDKVRGEDNEISQLRNKTVRESLMKDYSFYKDGFSPFTENNCSLKAVWENFAAYPEAAI